MSDSRSLPAAQAVQPPGSLQTFLMTSGHSPPFDRNWSIVMSEMLMNQVFGLFWDDITARIARLNILSNDQGFEGTRGAAGKGGTSRRFEGFEGFEGVWKWSFITGGFERVAKRRGEVIVFIVWPKRQKHSVNKHPAFLNWALLMNIYTWFYVLYSNTYTVSCGVGATLILNYARETSYLALKGKCFFLYPSIKIKFLFEGMQWRKMSKNPIPGHDTVSLQFQLWSRHRTKLEKRKMKKIWRFLKFMLPCSKWDLFNTLYIKHTTMFLKGFIIQHPCFTETLPFFPPNHIIYHSAPTNPSSFGQ